MFVYKILAPDLISSLGNVQDCLASFVLLVKNTTDVIQEFPWSGAMKHMRLYPFGSFLSSLKSSLTSLGWLVAQNINSVDVRSMFTRVAHHRPYIIVYITQILYQSRKEARSRNPRFKSRFQENVRQIRPGNMTSLSDKFKAATAKFCCYLFGPFSRLVRRLISFVVIFW